jgi:hypothetical protein
MISQTKSRIREKWEYLLFLGALLTLIAYTYSLTTQFRVPETAELPRLVIFGMAVVILVDLVLTLFPQLLPEQLRSESSTESSFENRNIRPVTIGIQFGWVLLFLAGMYFVGFFTATTTFAFLYVFVYGPEETPLRRFGVSIAWAAGINIFLYVLFVELLQVGSVFNFGFLP